MLAVIVAVVGCALVCAWPTLVVRRVSPRDAARALEPPAAPSPAQTGSTDVLTAAATSIGRAVRAAVMAATGQREPEAPKYGPELDALVRRARRSRLWAVPLVVGVALDLTLLVTPMGWAVGLAALGLVLVADAALVTCAIVMLVLGLRRTVSVAERDRFLQAWGPALAAKAERFRARDLEERRAQEAEAHGWEQDAAPILDEALGSQLTDVRRRLASARPAAATTLAAQLDELTRRLRVLEASPHRDGHSDAAAQTYAEQAVDALSSYLQLASPTSEDAGKVADVLGIATSALARETDRLDGKARLNLDVTRRGTEALYGHRYGGDSGRH